MKLRSHASEDPFDGLTAEDIRRIRGGAAASVTPGMENFPVPRSPVNPGSTERRVGPRPGTDAPPRKRGRRT